MKAADRYLHSYLRPDPVLSKLDIAKLVVKRASENNPAMTRTVQTKRRRARTLPDPGEMAAHAEEAAALLKALAHPARLLVLCRLVEGEASVSELQPLAGLSMSALSQHLAILREMHLVTTRRESQTIYYSLAEGPATGVLDSLYAAYCATS